MLDPISPDGTVLADFVSKASKPSAWTASGFQTLFWFQGVTLREGTFVSENQLGDCAYSGKVY